MPTFYSPTGNPEIWDVCPQGYLTEEEYIESQRGKIFAIVGTNTVRVVQAPYEDIQENEIEVQDFPPNSDYILTDSGTWVINEPLVLPKRKEELLTELNNLFTVASNEAHLLSSVGFEIDATETANRDITGLIIVMEATNLQTVSFCDYNNEFHTVSLNDLKTMQLEVIQNGQELYTKKWLLREAINNATTIAELEAIQISF